MHDRGRRKWWVVGCWVVPAIGILAIAIIAGLTWWSSRAADPRSDLLVHENSAPDTDAHRDQDPGSATNTLRVLLELDGCEVYIEPAAPGGALRVEAHYDAHDYRIEEFAEEGTPDVYRLQFLITRSRWITGLKQGFRGGQPQIRISLPVDRPLELVLVQRNGGALVDLSGLHLLTAEFDVSGTLLTVDSDERLQGDLERFTVNGRKGWLVLESLDLMEPKHVDIDFRMGQAQLDFRGTWVSDTTVDLSMSMADAIVRLPRDARITGIGADPVAPAIDEELRPPTLEFSVDSGRRTTLRVFE